MDMDVLRKKISTYRSEGGKLTNVSDELLGEILSAWENWTGPSIQFYGALGVSHRKLAGLLGKAKRLKRDGRFGEGDFKEIQIEAGGTCGLESSSCSIEVSWENGRVIRFSQVEQLVDFLKKVA